MRKSIILFVFLLVFFASGCSNGNSEKTNDNPGEKYHYIKEHPTEFFSADIKVEKELNSYSNKYHYYWIINISPVSTKYKFSAANEMDLWIYYSNTRDNGVHDDLDSQIVEVKYDENGYGYKKESINGSYNLIDVVYLFCEMEVSSFETATLK